MNIIIIIAILGILIFTIILGLGYLLVGRVNIKDRLRMDVSPDEDGQNETGWDSIQKKYEQVAKTIGEQIPRSPDEMSKQERRLVKAGIRRKDSVTLFFGSKVLIGIFFLCFFTAAGLMWKSALLCVLFSVFLGMLLPDLWLQRAIAVRADRIQLALPNALDLAVVCVEAGMGLDQALQRIGREMKKGFSELSDEFNVLDIEIRAGRPRADALRNLAGRTESRDMKSLVAVLVQTERFGTSIAQSLRTYADTIRVTRRLRAEELAAKMTIKLVPPLVFFIFPAILVVILGPAIMKIGAVLSSMGN